MDVEEEIEPKKVSEKIDLSTVHYCKTTEHQVLPR